MPDGSRKKPGGRALSDVSLYLSFKRVQFVQPDVNTLQIKYVPDDPGAAPELTDLTRMLGEEFHDKLDVQLVPVERIERSAGMKIDHSFRGLADVDRLLIGWKQKILSTTVSSAAGPDRRLRNSFETSEARC